MKQEISKKTLDSFNTLLVSTTHYFLLSRKWCCLVVEASDETEPTSFDDSVKTIESLRLLLCVVMCLNHSRSVCLLTNKEMRYSRTTADSRWDTQRLL